MAQFRICEFQAVFDMIFKVSKNFYSLLYCLNNSNSQLPTVNKTTKSMANLIQACNYKTERLEFFLYLAQNYALVQSVSGDYRKSKEYKKES